MGWDAEIFLHLIEFFILIPTIIFSNKLLGHLLTLYNSFAFGILRSLEYACLCPPSIFSKQALSDSAIFFAPQMKFTVWALYEEIEIFDHKGFSKIPAVEFSQCD